MPLTSSKSSMIGTAWGWPLNGRHGEGQTGRLREQDRVGDRMEGVGGTGWKAWCGAVGENGCISRSPDKPTGKRRSLLLYVAGFYPNLASEVHKFDSLPVLFTIKPRYFFLCCFLFQTRRSCFSNSISNVFLLSTGIIYACMHAKKKNHMTQKRSTGD